MFFKVKNLTILTDTALGEQSRRKEDHDLAAVQEKYSKWLHETGNLQKALNDEGKTMSELMDAQIVAFQDLSTDSQAAIVEVEEQLAITTALMEKIAQRQTFLESITGSTEEQQCSRDDFGAVTAKFVLKNHQVQLKTTTAAF